MKNITIKKTEFTPFVKLDAKKHIHEIRGESYPENSIEYYEPIIEWLEKYIEKLKKREKAVFNLEIIYFNSSTSKILMDIFDILDEGAKKGKTLEVNWYYDEDNDIALECGMEFKEDLKHLIFNIKKV
ncbi:MAG: DUF1987 domain-containing protein [Campylobacterales bacterium]